MPCACSVRSDRVQVLQALHHGCHPHSSSSHRHIPNPPARVRSPQGTLERDLGFPGPDRRYHYGLLLWLQLRVHQRPQLHLFPCRFQTGWDNGPCCHAVSVVLTREHLDVSIRTCAARSSLTNVPDDGYHTSPCRRMASARSETFVGPETRKWHLHTFMPWNLTLAGSTRPGRPHAQRRRLENQRCQKDRLPRTPRFQAPRIRQDAKASARRSEHRRGRRRRNHRFCARRCHLPHCKHSPNL